MSQHPNRFAAHPARRSHDERFTQGSLFGAADTSDDTSQQRAGRASIPPTPPASAAPRPVASTPQQPTRSPSRPATPPQQRIIQLGGATVPYLLKVSARARRIRFIVRPTGALEVVTPRGVAQSRIEEALREKARWILSTQARMAEREAPPAPEPLRDGRELPCAGRMLHLRIIANSTQEHTRIHRMGDLLTVTTPTPTQETLHAVLEAWYRREARRVIGERLALWNARYGFTYSRVAIKEQKTRWGSCSRKGNLNFNWRLLLAPLPVLDYVLIHELAHLKEQNHAPRFWALVAQLCPEYREQRRWLRLHGQELRF